MGHAPPRPRPDTLRRSRWPWRRRRTPQPAKPLTRAEKAVQDWLADPDAEATALEATLDELRAAGTFDEPYPAWHRASVASWVPADSATNGAPIGIITAPQLDAGAAARLYEQFTATDACARPVVLEDGLRYEAYCPHQDPDAPLFAEPELDQRD